jgi:hypothetical protein
VKPRCDTLLRLTLSLIAFLALVLPTRGADDKKSAPDKTKSSQTNKYVRPTNPSLYVGADTCKTCHEEIYNNFATTPHVATTMEGKLEANKGPEWHGCEACHGPGKAHVEGRGDVSKIFTFKNATPEETSARCLDCHQNREEQSNYSRSAHLQWRSLHRLSFAAPRESGGIPPKGIPAEALLRLPHGRAGSLQGARLVQ